MRLALYWHQNQTKTVQSVQLLSCVLLFATPWITAHQASLSITNSWSSLKLMSIKWVTPSSHLILCRPLLLLPQIPPSIRVFSNEATPRMRWPQYWSFSFSIIPSKEIPRLISFRMDCLALLAVQGTLKSVLQHHSSKASILWRSAFLTVQLSHPYMTIGKTIALTRQTFVGKVMSLLLNMLSRLVITFLPRSKHLLISWLQSPSAVILEPKKIKSDTVSTVSSSICHEVMGPDAMILVFWIQQQLNAYRPAAAAAKSLQSCPTLCDPIDGSPPGSPVPGILQARTLEWVAISFSNAWKWKVKVKSFSCVRPSVTPWTAAYQAPPSMGFSRQEYWSGMPLPSPTDQYHS